MLIIAVLRLVPAQAVLLLDILQAQVQARLQAQARLLDILQAQVLVQLTTGVMFSRTLEQRQLMEHIHLKTYTMDNRDMNTQHIIYNLIVHLIGKYMIGMAGQILNTMDCQLIHLTRMIGKLLTVHSHWEL